MIEMRSVSPPQVRIAAARGAGWMGQEEVAQLCAELIYYADINLAMVLRLLPWRRDAEGA
jgi:hypothetical protein